MGSKGVVVVKKDTGVTENCAIFLFSNLQWINLNILEF